jgi:hypothetical protein
MTSAWGDDDDDVSDSRKRPRTVDSTTCLDDTPSFVSVESLPVPPPEYLPLKLLGAITPPFTLQQQPIKRQRRYELIVSRFALYSELHELCTHRRVKHTIILSVAPTTWRDSLSQSFASKLRTDPSLIIGGDSWVEVSDLCAKSVQLRWAIHERHCLTMTSEEEEAWVVHAMIHAAALDVNFCRFFLRYERRLILLRMRMATTVAPAACNDVTMKSVLGVSATDAMFRVERGSLVQVRLASAPWFTSTKAMDQYQPKFSEKTPGLVAFGKNTSPEALVYHVENVLLRRLKQRVLHVQRSTDAWFADSWRAERDGLSTDTQKATRELTVLHYDDAADSPKIAEKLQAFVQSLGFNDTVPLLFAGLRAWSIWYAERCDVELTCDSRKCPTHVEVKERTWRVGNGGDLSRENNMEKDDEHDTVNFFPLSSAEAFAESFDDPTKYHRPVVSNDNGETTDERRDEMGFALIDGSGPGVTMEPLLMARSFVPASIADVVELARNGGGYWPPCVSRMILQAVDEGKHPKDGARYNMTRFFYGTGMSMESITRLFYFLFRCNTREHSGIDMETFIRNNHFSAENYQKQFAHSGMPYCSQIIQADLCPFAHPTVVLARATSASTTTLEHRSHVTLSARSSVDIEDLAVEYGRLLQVTEKNLHGGKTPDANRVLQRRATRDYPHDVVSHSLVEIESQRGTHAQKVCRAYLNRVLDKRGFDGTRFSTFTDRGSTSTTTTPRPAKVYQKKRLFSSTQRSSSLQYEKIVADGAEAVRSVIQPNSYYGTVLRTLAAAALVDDE